MQLRLKPCLLPLELRLWWLQRVPQQPRQRQENLPSSPRCVSRCVASGNLFLQAADLPQTLLSAAAARVERLPPQELLGDVLVQRPSAVHP
ncbi:hypothetical protein cyc_00566 [Cyclospora cayetanensis]|uniref:Uncharacterized protein n=1 Tax=Cyclospora cayetanensis TaxID=88456 RepID=A0A1D3D3D0_9EIME|nr:hypothetical protein cyc_00566 [Cyclospora cayetanensis]